MRKVDARYYEPKLSMFISMDPMMGKYPWISPYVYCANNPLRYIDPTGMSYTNFEDADGNLVKHVEDGSNAVFRETGAGINKHYAFNRFDESQKGTNTVNLTTALQEAQNLNDNNSSLNPSGGNTYCNYATQNILKTMSSAIRTESGTSPDRLVETGRANDMSANFATNPLLRSVTATEANDIASQGGFVVMGYINSTQGRSGHVATLAIGDNFVAGQTTIANIGANNGFLPYSQVYSSKSTVSYYTFTNDVKSKFLPRICNIMNWFNK